MDCERPSPLSLVVSVTSWVNLPDLSNISTAAGPEGAVSGVYMNTLQNQLTSELSFEVQQSTPNMQLKSLPSVVRTWQPVINFAFAKLLPERPRRLTGC